MLKRIQHYLFQFLVAVDQLINTMLGGWADETLSARCWRLRAHRGWHRAYRFIDTLFFWQEGHCRQAFDSEWSRQHLPPPLRNMRRV